MPTVQRSEHGANGRTHLWLGVDTTPHNIASPQHDTTRHVSKNARLLEVSEEEVEVHARRAAVCIDNFCIPCSHNPIQSNPIQSCPIVSNPIMPTQHPHRDPRIRSS